MTLQEFCNTLKKEQKFDLAIKLAKTALPIWKNFSENNSLSYRDSVIGMMHDVPKMLLIDTINEVEIYHANSLNLRAFQNNSRILKLRSYFDDPIVALQDSDWELPKEVESVFYSVYNLLEAAMGNHTTVFNEPTIYVSINQAIDAIETAGLKSEAEIREILEQFDSVR